LCNESTDSFLSLHADMPFGVLRHLRATNAQIRFMGTPHLVFCLVGETHQAQRDNPRPFSDGCNKGIPFLMTAFTTTGGGCRRSLTGSVGEPAGGQFVKETDGVKERLQAFHTGCCADTIELVVNPIIPPRELAVQHIELSAQGEAIKQFFLSLPVDPEGSVVELNGQAVARVTPIKGQDNGASQAPGPWTEVKNARRCVLVDREIDGTLTPEEATELEILQQQMLRERRRLAPVPLEDLRRLHQELLTKAQQQARPGDA
jgi:hypothetical protein